MTQFFSKKWILLAIGAISGLLLLLVPEFAVFAQQTCSLSPIPLEVPLGSEVTTTTGLTNYITQVYTFMVGAIGVIATVMIMFHGFGWTIAAGNAEDIAKAKSGIISAIIGLVLAFTSYALLNIINPATVNLVDICPTGLSFSDSGPVWEQCPGGGDGECTSFDYCEFGCSCDLIPNGTTVCRPTAIQTLGAGLRCHTTENCGPPLQCVNARDNGPGTCAVGTEGAICETDRECPEGLTCVEVVGETTTLGVGDTKKCLPTAGRSNLESCENDQQCASGICHSFYDKCVSGIGGAEDLAGCNTSNPEFDCAPGYLCTLGTCNAKVEGDTCKEANQGAAALTNAACNGTGGSGLFCVDHDGQNGTGPGNPATCWDGSLEDPCDSDSECTAAGAVCETLCVHTQNADGAAICSTRGEGSPCLNDNNCDPALAPYCVTRAGSLANTIWSNPNGMKLRSCPSGASIGTCYDGSIGDPCTTHSQCQTTCDGTTCN